MTSTWSVIKDRATIHSNVREIHYSKAVFRHRKSEDELGPPTGTGWRRADGDAFLIGRLPKEIYSPIVRTKLDFVRRRTERWEEVKKWEKFPWSEFLGSPTNCGAAAPLGYPPLLKGSFIIQWLYGVIATACVHQRQDFTILCIQQQSQYIYELWNSMHVAGVLLVIARD